MSKSFGKTEYKLGDDILKVLRKYDKGRRIGFISRMVGVSRGKASRICELDHRIKKDFNKSWKPAEEYGGENCEFGS